MLEIGSCLMSIISAMHVREIIRYKLANLINWMDWSNWSDDV
jgi:hypothetical protein